MPDKDGSVSVCLLRMRRPGAASRTLKAGPCTSHSGAARRTLKTGPCTTESSRLQPCTSVGISNPQAGLQVRAFARVGVHNACMGQWLI